MMAVLSGYLYYGWSIFQTRSRGCLKNFFRNYFCLLSALDLRCGKTHSFVDVLSQI